MNARIQKANNRKAAYNKMIESEIIKWLVPFICGGAISLCGTVLSMWKTKRKRQRAVEDGLQCLLRAEIIRSYEKYSERGFAPVYAKEALRRVYISYHTLEGNDVATDLYNKTMALPTESKKENE